MLWRCYDSKNIENYESFRNFNLKLPHIYLRGKSKSMSIYMKTCLWPKHKCHLMPALLFCSIFYRFFGVFFGLFGNDFRCYCFARGWIESARTEQRSLNNFPETDYWNNIKRVGDCSLLCSFYFRLFIVFHSIDSASQLWRKKEIYIYKKDMSVIWSMFLFGQRKTKLSWLFDLIGLLLSEMLFSL